MGRGILIDAARYKNKKHLDRGEGVTLDDLLDAAKKQNVTIEKHDILVLHTGWLNRFYEEGVNAFFPDGKFDEPGLEYSPELVKWFHEMEIVSISADNVGCEQGINKQSGGLGLLHGALLCNLESSSTDRLAGRILRTIAPKMGNTLSCLQVLLSAGVRLRLLGQPDSDQVESIAVFNRNSYYAIKIESALRTALRTK